MATCALSHSINNQVKSSSNNPISLCRWSNWENVRVFVIVPLRVICIQYALFTNTYTCILQIQYTKLNIAGAALSYDKIFGIQFRLCFFLKVWICSHNPHIICGLTRCSLNVGKIRNKLKTLKYFDILNLQIKRHDKNHFFFLQI